MIYMNKTRELYACNTMFFVKLPDTGFYKNDLKTSLSQRSCQCRQTICVRQFL